MVASGGLYWFVWRGERDQEIVGNKDGRDSRKLGSRNRKRPSCGRFLFGQLFSIISAEFDAFNVGPVGPV